MTARDHNKLLSIFFYVSGGLQILVGIFIFLIYGGMGVMMLSQAQREEEQMIGGIFTAMGFVIGLFVLVFAALFLFTGWKMQKQQKLGKTLGIISSILSLLSFPLGTALGIYGLWFFFGDEGKNFYNGGGNHTGYNPPPPPNSWQ